MLFRHPITVALLATIVAAATPVLTEADGWGIVVGFGAGMTALTYVLILLDKHFNGAKETAEEIYSAGRNNTSGLTASVLVSQWTWTATILESANVAWKYGIAGPFWYAAGSTVHIMLFAIVGIEVKRKAPNMHTVTEFMLVRHGRFSHIVFLVFALLSNVLVSATLIVGGASIIENLTGINRIVCVFLIPASVLMYTTTGGLKATFFACYLNALFVFLVTMYFVLDTYFSNADIGSSQTMFQLLVNASMLVDQEDNNTYPPQSAGTVTVTGLNFRDGNHHHSYLTLSSNGALVFGIINILGNFGTVFVDQSYWQSAIAAANSATVPGFLLGGIAWFPIPFAMSTSIGLACRALQLGITVAEANEGLVPAYAVSHMLGHAGSMLLLIILFLATTSTGSAELISVSSLLTYDVYLEYIPTGKRLKKQLLLTSKVGWASANNAAPYPDSLKQQNAVYQKKLLRVTMAMTLLFAVLMGFLALILDRAGINLSWLYLSTGIWLGPAVIPIVISFFWAKANGFWCSLGAIMGLLVSLTVWLLYAFFLHGQVTIKTLRDDTVLLTANLVSLVLGGLISVVGSHMQPDHFRWQNTIDGIKRTDDDPVQLLDKTEVSIEFLNQEARKSRIQGSVWTVTFLVLPLALFFSNYVLSSSIFDIWVTISVVWAFGGTYIGIILPIVQELKKSLLAYYERKRLAKEAASRFEMETQILLVDKRSI